MKIAVIGAGISGLTAALLLQKKYEVKVFEAENWIGGHTHTVPVLENNSTLWIDTGFIVFNNKNYPNFMKLLSYLDVEYQKTKMSFSVRADAINLEYNGTNINGLFAQRKNIIKPKFWGMLNDIIKFNSAAKSFAKSQCIEISLKEFIAPLKLDKFCIEYYLLPMIAAIWSTASDSTLSMPAWFVCDFLENHGMLNINDRPTWYSIVGGSHEYIKKIHLNLGEKIQVSTPVSAISRNKTGVTVVSTQGQEDFDKVIMATHSDQALKLLADPSLEEQKLLENIRYTPNEVVLHTDISLLPKNRRAWASWNYCVNPRNPGSSLVTYNMNILQNLKAAKTYCVSLNQTELIEPKHILQKFQYSHPLYDLNAKASQARFSEISGLNNTYYCGAYWGSGFHEDGVNSGLEVVKQIDKELLCAVPFILD